MNNKVKLILFFIFLVAFLVRVVGIGSYPVGFTQDEASIGYDAYSLLKTGKDQWGESYPLVLRSFGDFKMPLYSYLAIIPVKIFGLSVFSVRLVNAVFGFLAVIATYFMVKKLTSNEKLSIVSSLFLAISPWHISMSRGAFEANLITFFIPFIVWLFLKGLKKPLYMGGFLIAVLISIFSYHSARLFIPIFVFLLFVSFYKQLVGKDVNLKKSIKLVLLKYWWLVSGLLMIFLFILISAKGNSGERGLDVLILNPTDNWASVADRRYEAVLIGVPDFISRVFSNKLNYVFKEFVASYLSYFSFSFLFTKGAGEFTYGMMPGRGVLYLVEIVGVLAGLYAYIKGRGFKKMGFILLWILISPIPAAFSKSFGNAANRVTTMLPAISILSAFGFIYIAGLLDKYKKPFNIKKYLFFPLISFIFIVSMLFFWEDYLFHTPYHASSAMHAKVPEVIKYLKENENDYEKIFISRSLSVPNIWVAFYEKIDPAIYQKYSRYWYKYEEEGYQYLDQVSSYELGKYQFGSIDFQRQRGQNSLIVGRPEEFPADTITKKEILFPNKEPAYYIVDASTL